MTWRDRLVPASFDGAPFFVDSDDLDEGPRVHVQKFPDTPRVEVQNFGNDAREFTVNAYLIGPNYDFDRDVLRDALLSGGARPLTLPTWGTKSVTVDQKFKTHTTKGEGGFCRITFHAVEDVPEEPFSRVARPAVLEKQSGAVVAAAKGDLSQKFTVAGLPSASQASSLTALTTAADALKLASDRIAGAAGQVNDAAATIDAFADDAEALMSTPTALAESIGSVVSAALNVATTGLDALETAGAPLRELARLTDIALSAGLDAMGFAAGLGTVNSGSANGAREATNKAAVVSTVQLVTIAEVCRLTTALPFESYVQATSARGLIVDAFDGILDALGDAVINDALLLRANLVQHLDAAAAALPDLRTYTTPRLMSCSEVAHEVYGDASRADEVADRNRLGAPLFVPAGTALELLSV